MTPPTPRRGKPKPRRKPGKAKAKAASSVAKVRRKDRTPQILREVLAREVAAKAFYESLLEAVRGTEFERFADRLQAMVDEEAGHAEAVRRLLEKHG